jgi:hypothetical protein
VAAEVEAIDVGEDVLVHLRVVWVVADVVGERVVREAVVVLAGGRRRGEHAQRCGCRSART